MASSSLHPENWGFSLPWIESLNEIETNLLNARSALTQACAWLWTNANPVQDYCTTLTRADSMRATPTEGYWLLIRLWLV